MMQRQGSRAGTPCCAVWPSQADCTPWTDLNLGNCLRDILLHLTSAVHDHAWLSTFAALTGKLLDDAVKLLGICHL